MIADTISGVYDKANDAKSVETLRDELTGKIQNAISHVFEDLSFSSLGQPLTNGNFYFTKGTTTNFSYYDEDGQVFWVKKRYPAIREQQLLRLLVM